MNNTTVRVVAAAILAVGLGIAFWIWPEPAVEDREERLLRQGGAILVSVFTLAVVLKAWMETFPRRS
jgi:hypothetical protein